MSHAAPILKHKNSFKPWIVTITASLFFMYSFAQMNMFNALGPDMVEFFKIDALELGNLSAMSLYGNVLLIPIAGIILDRFSTRQVILVSMIICTFATLFFSFATNYHLAAFFRFVAGCTGAFCFLSAIVLCSRWFEPQSMAKVIGFIVTMAMLGGALAQEPMLILIDQFGWHAALRYYAFLGFFFIFFMYFFLEDTPEQKVFYPPPRMKYEDLKDSFFAATSNPQNWLCGGYTSLMNLIVIVIGAVWGAGYLQSVHRLSLHEANEITFLIFVGTMIGSPVVGAISDRLQQRKTVMMYGAIVSLLLSLILIVNDQLNFMVLSSIFFLLGFTTSTQVISYPVIVESNASKNTGVSESLASFLILGTGAIYQNLYGLVMNLHAKNMFFMPSDYVYTAADHYYAFWLIPVAFVISIILASLITETNAQRLTS